MFPGENQTWNSTGSIVLKRLLTKLRARQLGEPVMAASSQEDQGHGGMPAAGGTGVGGQDASCHCSTIPLGRGRDTPPRP